MDYEIFCKNIRGVRTRMGMTQEQFAGLIGTTRSSVADWENCRTIPRIDVAYTVAEKTNADITWLMTGCGSDDGKETDPYDAKFRVYNEADRKTIVPILVANGYDVGQHKEKRNGNGKTVDYFIHIRETSGNIESSR